MIRVSLTAIFLALSLGGGSARLTLTASQPLTVHGAAFHARERVRVVVHDVTGASFTHRVRATRRGTFTTVFRRLTVDRCSGVVVTATGRRGSRATLRRPAIAACPPL